MAFNNENDDCPRQQEDKPINQTYGSSFLPSENRVAHDGMEESKYVKFARKIFANVTIEPMLFLKMVAESNFKIIGDTLEIDRICKISLNYSDSDCEMMDDGNHTDIQNDVQKYQNIFNYHQNLMDSIIPLLMILLIGPISDIWGRKSAMITVLAGFIGLSSIYTLAALNPSWPVQVLYIATLFVDLGGTWVVFNMAVYSYMADITSVESRTKRMGFTDAVWYLGSPIGTLLGGFVYKTFGYAAVFGLSSILWLVCLLYTIFFVKENRHEHENLRCGPFSYIVSLFTTVFRKRPEKRHFHIITLMGLKLGTFFVQGHQTYVWARKVLQWSPTTFSTWSSLEEGSHQAGMVGWVWIGERLNLHDCTIANGSLLSILLWSVTLACITGPTLWWLTILASILGLLEAGIEPAIRSMLTAAVGLGEEGRVLAMLGILESAWLSVDRALYTYTYNAFIDIFPQINFVIQAGFALILIIVVFLLKRSISKHSQEQRTTPVTYQHSHDS